MATADNFLAHYGVKGMKWGRRKKRSDDGSSTSSPKKLSEDAEKALDYKSTLGKEGINALSNQELQTLVTRMNLEKQYNKLTESKPGAGQKMAQDILNKAGEETVRSIGSFSEQRPAKVPSKEVELYTPPTARRIAGDVVKNVGSNLASEFASQLVAEAGKVAVEAVFNAARSRR